MPSMPKTRVMDPLAWSLPPRAITHREVVSKLPATDSSKPPVLFVHGLGHGAWCWAEHWLDATAAAGHPAHALSLRGHGGSDGADDLRRWKLRDYAHDVLQVATSLPAPPVLVGHSMGALVVERVLETYPARGGVFVAPAGHTHGIGIGVNLARRHPLGLLAGTVGRPIRLRAQDLFAQLDPSTAERYTARLTDESPLAQYQILLPRRRRHAKAPVLVIGGEADRLVSVVDVRRMAARHGTRAHVFRGMGHDLMLERDWKAPLDLILRWMDRDLGPS